MFSAGEMRLSRPEKADILRDLGDKRSTTKYVPPGDLPGGDIYFGGVESISGKEFDQRILDVLISIDKNISVQKTSEPSKEQDGLLRQIEINSRPNGGGNQPRLIPRNAGIE